MSEWGFFRPRRWSGLIVICTFTTLYNNDGIFKREVSLAGQCRARTTFQKFPFEEEFQKRLFGAAAPQLRFFTDKYSVACWRLSFLVWETSEWLLVCIWWVLRDRNVKFVPFKPSLLAEQLGSLPAASPNSHRQWKANCLLVEQKLQQTGKFAKNVESLLTWCHIFEKAANRTNIYDWCWYQ